MDINSLSSSGRRCRLWPLILLFVAFHSVCSAAQPVFVTVRSTPYDKQMARINRALISSGARSPIHLSMTTITQCLTNLRELPYSFSPKWMTPAEVKAANVADCKGKAVMLYAQMQAMGAKNLRFVIGKHHVYDSKTHAWLEWQTQDGNYLLDPTFNWTIARTAEQDPMTYIPYYAYEGGRKYRARQYHLTYPLPVAQH